MQRNVLTPVVERVCQEVLIFTLGLHTGGESFGAAAAAAVVLSDHNLQQAIWKTVGDVKAVERQPSMTSFLREKFVDS